MSLAPKIWELMPQPLKNKYRNSKLGLPSIPTNAHVGCVTKDFFFFFYSRQLHKINVKTYNHQVRIN